MTAQNPTPGLFATFIISLSSAALVEMGVIPDPTDPKKAKKSINKEAARQHIEILSMIQKKTLGNLDPHEKELIEHALTDLKMQFAKTL